MISIRPITKQDTEVVFMMMRIFHDSPAVLHKTSDAALRQDIADCISSDFPFVEGFVFEEDDCIAGYSMIAKSYSTEYGGLCLWIEDIYIKPQWRGHGIGTQFLTFVEEKYRSSAVRLRLEVEKSNTEAIAVYKRCCFDNLPYIEMTKEL